MRLLVQSIFLLFPLLAAAGPGFDISPSQSSGNDKYGADSFEGNDFECLHTLIKRRGRDELALDTLMRFYNKTPCQTLMMLRAYENHTAGK